MILEQPRMSRDAFSKRTGWVFKPEGACLGDLCVPMPEPDGPDLDAQVISERLGMPLIHDEASGLWCLGPESLGRGLQVAESPGLHLPDWLGRPFHLASLRGRKVLLLAWASW